MTRRPLAIARGLTPPLALGLLFGALGAVGCIDPKADYEDFASRPLVQRDGGFADVERAPCEQLLEQDPSGRYLLSCRPSALPTPFGLSLTQTVTRGADSGAAEIVLSFTPLQFGAMSLSETAGDVTTLPATPISADCGYTENVGTLTLGAKATVLDRELTATNVVLRGRLLSKDRSCGELDGNVDIIMLDLNKDGDVCVMVRAPDDGSVPAVTDADYSCDPSLLPPRGSH